MLQSTYASVGRSIGVASAGQRLVEEPGDRRVGVRGHSSRRHGCVERRDARRRVVSRGERRVHVAIVGGRREALEGVERPQVPVLTKTADRLVREAQRIAALGPELHVVAADPVHTETDERVPEEFRPAS
jgi:hypothetical protein